MLKNIDVRWFCNTYSSDNTVPSFEYWRDAVQAFVHNSSSGDRDVFYYYYSIALFQSFVYLSSFTSKYPNPCLCML